jgi:hypothetical protein
MFEYLKSPEGGPLLLLSLVEIGERILEYIATCISDYRRGLDW